MRPLRAQGLLFRLKPVMEQWFARVLHHPGALEDKAAVPHAHRLMVGDNDVIQKRHAQRLQRRNQVQRAVDVAARGQKRIVGMIVADDEWHARRAHHSAEHVPRVNGALSVVPRCKNTQASMRPEGSRASM